MNKRGLGKGLGALIPTSITAKQPIEYDPERDLLHEIDIDEIVPNKTQPRYHFNTEKLAELAASIKEHGLVQPIVVRPHEKGYEIVAGERRFRACKQLGLTKIKAIIKTLSDLEVTEIALIENLQRQDLNPIEESKSYKRLIDQFGLTQDEIARKIAKSRPYIANSLRLLHLPDDIIVYLEKGDISSGHGRALLSINGHPQQQQVLNKIITENLSVRDTEKLIKKVITTKGNTENTKKNIKTPKSDILLNDIQDHLKTKFGTKVSIKDKGERGTIEIEYYNQQDLQRIIEIITDQERF